MSGYELITDEDYASLPDDDEECFVAVEAVCRRNMIRMIDENTSGDFDRAVREQYMTTVSATAEQCGISGIGIPRYDNNANFLEAFGVFSLRVQGEVARIKVKGRGFRHPYSVQLLPTTRTKINHHITRIRHYVEQSDLSPSRKRELGAKLDELIKELDQSRLSFGKTMAVLSTILVGLAAATTIAAEGPSAVTNIMKLIGTDKATEDAAKLRLAPPQKALPAPTQVATTMLTRPGPSWDAPATDFDDEIPF